MKKSLFVNAFTQVFILTFLLNVAFVHKTYAEEKSMKIAIINMQKIEQDTQASKDLQKKISLKEQELQKDLITRKNKIENKFRELESKRAVMSGEALQKEAKKLESDYQKLQMDEKMYMQIFEMARMFVLQEMQGYVVKATNKVASDKYDAVVPSAMFIYINDDKFDDITKKVVSQMDNISKKVDYEKAYKNAQEQVKKMLEAQKK